MLVLLVVISSFPLVNSRTPVSSVTKADLPTQVVV